MVLVRALRSHHFYRFCRHQNASLFMKKPLNTSSITHPSFPDTQKCNSRSNSFLVSSTFPRTFSASAQVEERIEIESTGSDEDKSSKKSGYVVKKTKCMKRFEKNLREKKGKKPLDVMFKEAVGLCEKLEESETSEDEFEEGEFGLDSSLKESKELKKKLRKLEREVRNLKGNEKETGNQKKNPKKFKAPEVQSQRKSLYALFTNKSDYDKKSAASKQEGGNSISESESLKQD
ncbi:hypothetical protein HHK36_023490 [Tetracentron sinense]|uniref:Uncharacterized protein n=1 Tax=Tetracentron sinense TaxID=13715 RepID=A0A835D5A1_TETSI|nr:hypothetical protein HHK36_023490 [Tetracentron sinense]